MAGDLATAHPDLVPQPLFWLLRRSIRADQEALADAAASTIHGDGRLAYAETLVGWAKSWQGTDQGALASAALALWERPSLLESRVRTLIDPDLIITPKISRRGKLAAVGLGLIGALALSLFTVRPTTVTAQVMKAPSTDRSVPGPGHSRTDEKAERFEYAGLVLGPDGKPIAGAQVHLAYFRYLGKSALHHRATTGTDGRFRFAVTKKDFSETDNDTPWTTAIVVAQREGLGLGWADAGDGDKKKINPLDLTIRLARRPADLGPDRGSSRQANRRCHH